MKQEWTPIDRTRRKEDQRLLQTSFNIEPAQRRHLEQESKRRKRTMAQILREYVDFAIEHKPKEA